MTPATSRDEGNNKVWLLLKRNEKVGKVEVMVG